MLRGYGALPEMPRHRAPDGWKPGIRLTFVLLVICVLLAGCGGPAIPVTSGHAVDRAAMLPTPAPTATPDPVVLRNAGLGCAKGSPVPTSQIIYTGKMPSIAGPAPAEVALTFDDGPTPYTSPPILTFLEQSHTPATFFVEGQYVHEWPNLLEREWQDNFAIGVHTWDHPLMSQLSVPALEHQFGDTLSAIHSVIGANACVWLWRPPFADYNRTVLSQAMKYGLTTVTWDDSSNDWTRPGTDQIVQNVLSNAHPGAIVLMHDGPALREQTAAALPLIVQGLAQRGLTPVTLPKLLADGLYPGVQISAPAQG